jgi:hypothetical protein
MHGDTININYGAASTSIDENDMDNENENNLSGTNLLALNGVASHNSLTVSYNPEFEINNSSIDLDTYTSGYTGLMRINRLVFLAEHCPPVRVDALRMALTYVIETFNTQLYNNIHKQLTDAMSKL